MTWGDFMAVARKVLMIIAFIASIIVFLICALCGVTLFISIGNEELLTRLLDGMGKASLEGDARVMFVGIIGIAFFFIALMNIINAILSMKAVKSSKGGLMILNIIFGFLSGIYINILGGIFGLIEGKN